MRLVEGVRIDESVSAVSEVVPFQSLTFSRQAFQSSICTSTGETVSSAPNMISEGHLESERLPSRDVDDLGASVRRATSGNTDEVPHVWRGGDEV